MVELCKTKGFALQLFSERSRKHGHLEREQIKRRKGGFRIVL